MAKYSKQGEAIAADKTLSIEGKTKNFVDGDTSRVKILLYQDHPSWNSDVEAWEHAEGNQIEQLEHRTYLVCDERTIPAERLAIRADVQGNASDFIWELTWGEGSEPSKEIYAVIRAEYFFLERGAEKLVGKRGRTGVDSLFLMDDKLVICESKCGIGPKAPGYHDKWCARTVDATGKLGGASPQATQSDKRAGQSGGGRRLRLEAHPDVRINRNLMQMSWMWIYDVITSIVNSSTSSRVKDNWEAILDLWMEDNSCIERWFNYYGFGQFYVVPGKYRIRGARFAEVNAVDGTHFDKAKDKVIDWPEDNPWTEEEFQDLDEWSAFIDRENNNWKSVRQAARAHGKGAERAAVARRRTVDNAVAGR